MTPRSIRLWSALVGLVSAAATLATAEAVALIVAPESAPVLAVGSWVIDIVPPWVKDAAIALFGTADKIALLVGLGILVVALACAVGVVEFRRPPWGKVILLGVVAVALVAVLTRSEATWEWAVPTLAGLLAGGLVLHRTIRRLHAWDASSTVLARVEAPVTARESIDRRGFLTMLIAVAGASAVIGVAARFVNASVAAVTAVRDAVTLPRSTVAAPPLPAGSELDVEGITPLVSANDRFYRIDTAIQVPSVDTADWSLRITGLVENPIEITWDELLALPMLETWVTLMCVSNEVGGTLAGNAKWLGHPIRSLLERAKPLAGADMVLSRSVDGWTASTPPEVLQDANRDSILAVGMNGEPLPLQHGFPVRMVVPGLYGYVSATKWLTKLTVTTFDKDEAYWTPRGYDAKAPIKLSSRIDTPRIDKQVPAGPAKIAGVAWAQTVGIAKVEVSIDNGDWQSVNLTTAINDDTWVQWWMDWEATAGTHYVAVRATDKAGNLQIEKQAPIAPNGSSGWQRTLVRVG